MYYNWQQKDWRNFSYEKDDLETLLYSFEHKVGMLRGLSRGLDREQHTQVMVDIMVNEAIKTSEIEGEFISRKDVMSSIKNNLNLYDKEPIKDKRAAGIGNLVTTIQNSYSSPLTSEMLFDWHKKLLTHETHISLGKWRTHEEPMQVVSGAMGRQIVHFQAPPSEQVNQEMTYFINWFNNTSPIGSTPIAQAPIRAAIAHLYFETIHPFEDGNGRIGRAIAEKALIQTLGYPLLISLSTHIENDKKTYYKKLQQGQSSNEITEWIHFFVDIILKALEYSEQMLDFTLQKTKLLDRFNSQLNERQLKVVHRMLSEGPKGFEGGMTARKYVGITKTSKATATRDLQFLLGIGIFELRGKGRSVSYRLNL